VKGKWWKARPTVMHVYGLRSLESIFKIFVHPIFTSVYTVLKKVTVGVHCHTVFSDSKISKCQNSVMASSIFWSNYSLFVSAFALLKSQLDSDVPEH
jgi:hypothetical protein